MTDYFLEIESHFAKRRGTPFILSARDWALMKEWNADGIPLPVVIEAIDSVFDRNIEKGSKKTVNSLSYCRHAVKEMWAERRELQVGAGGTTPEESPADLLAALAARIEGSPHAAVRPFAIRIRELAAEKSVPRIEERLVELEHELIAAALAADPAREAVLAEASAVDVTKLDEKTRARTVEANLRRLVRARFEIPRLTLF